MKSVDAFTFASSTSSSSTTTTTAAATRASSSTTPLRMVDKKSGNVFQSFLGDVASSIIGGTGGGGNSNNMNEELDQKLKDITKYTL